MDWFWSYKMLPGGRWLTTAEILDRDLIYKYLFTQLFVVKFRGAKDFIEAKISKISHVKSGTFITSVTLSNLRIAKHPHYVHWFWLLMRDFGFLEYFTWNIRIEILYLFWLWMHDFIFLEYFTWNFTLNFFTYFDCCCKISVF